jgi:alpha 1,3-glucosidase
MALYGAVPFVMAHSVDRTVGVFWHNAAEMWVDVARPAAHDGAAAAIGDALARLWSRSATRVHAGASTYLHWIAESGVLDLFLLPGPTPHAVLQQYYALTGLPAMPPMFALGYHQVC